MRFVTWSLLHAILASAVCTEGHCADRAEPLFKLSELCKALPSKGPPAPDLCSPSKRRNGYTPEQAQAAIDAYWAEWAARDPGGAKAEKAMFEGQYLAAYPPPTDQLEAKHLRQMPIDAVCTYWREENLEIAFADIKRRGVFNPADLDAIREKTVRIGMRESALECAMGAPIKRNRTVTASSVSIQWVYDDAYIYTKNGVVTSWQD